MNISILDDCTIKKDKQGNFGVYYKGVFLWYTVYEDMQYFLDSGGEISVMKEDGEDFFMIIGKTPLIYDHTNYDFSTYGMWADKEAVEAWLSNPKVLY